LPFGYLSAGQQRRIAFAKLLVAHRPIWILDEPTAALDSSADRLFAELIIAHQKSGGIVLAATHQPLGLENVQEMRMTGFAGVSEGVWGWCRYFLLCRTFVTPLCHFVTSPPRGGRSLGVCRIRLQSRRTPLLLLQIRCWIRRCARHKLPISPLVGEMSRQRQRGVRSGATII
jgi:hypothetical protein